MAFKLDSELSAVNSILSAIGQAPVNTLKKVVNMSPTVLNGPQAGETTYDEVVYENPEVALCRNLLQECNVDVQNEVWHFNLEPAIPFSPLDSTDPILDGRIPVPQGALNMDVAGGEVWRTKGTNVVDRDGYLYDLDRHSFNWKNVGVKLPLYCNVTWLYPFEQVPRVFQRYITLKASARAATQLVANPDLFKLLSTQEAMARANCVEQDCQMGDYTFFGWPQGTVYRSYQPYRTLARGPMLGAVNVTRGGIAGWQV